MTQGGSAVYERRKEGVTLGGRFVFGRAALGRADPAVVLEGTPWTLRHRELVETVGDCIAMLGTELSLVNAARGTEGFDVLLSLSSGRVRFATLAEPSLRRVGARSCLLDGATVVAELVPVWKDSDDRAGVLARVETGLPRPAADAAALLLFRLEGVAMLDAVSEKPLPPGF